MAEEVRIVEAELLKVEPSDMILVRGPIDSAMDVIEVLRESFPNNQIITTGTDRNAIEILRASKTAKSDQLIFDRNYLLGQIGEVRALLRMADKRLQDVYENLELRAPIGEALEKLDRMQAWIDR